MTDTTAPDKKIGNDILIAIGVLVAVIVAALYFSGQQRQSLRASATGYDGLAFWLTDQDVATRMFAGGWSIDSASVGLLIAPIYDTRPDQNRTSPQTQVELLTQQDEFDINLYEIFDRADHVQTMLVLPKWRSGLRLTGLSHPALLVDQRPVQDLLHDLTSESVGELGRIPAVATEFDYRTSDGRALTARLYVAQTFVGKGCEPLIGRPGRMVLGRCPADEATISQDVLILSDPDLFSNHGLRLGDNALVAADLLPMLAAQGDRYRTATGDAEAASFDILIDYATISWIRDFGGGVTRERTWDDLKRFFGYPFTLLWLGGAALLLLFIWRGGLRYGPVLGEASKLTASKMQAIAARGRLMRMTGQDGALLSEYVTARLGATAAAIFGPAQTAGISREQAFLKLLMRQNPALGANLTVLLNDIRALPAGIAAQDAIDYINAFEDILEQTAHDT